MLADKNMGLETFQWPRRSLVTCCTQVRPGATLNPFSSERRLLTRPEDRLRQKRKADFLSEEAAI